MFKLNQIQTDIRRELQEETKEDKVHSKRDIYIKNNKAKKPYVDEININNKYKESLTIDAVKYKEEFQVDANKDLIIENKKGFFIDKTK